jgi:hypothetical protein
MEGEEKCLQTSGWNTLKEENILDRQKYIK